MLQSIIHDSQFKFLYLLLPSVFFVLVFSFSLCHAQTEIEGEVSGVWTAEDSPYIVTDSTWVPEDSMLTIEAGVTVLFEEDMGLDVFGLISVEGTEDDSVFFIPANDSAYWIGFQIFESDFENTFNFCSMNIGGNAFELDDNTTLSIENSTVTAGGRSVVSMIERRSWGQSLQIENSVINSELNIYLVGAIIKVSGSILNDNYGAGIETSDSWIELEDSRLIGGVSSISGYTKYTNCEFYKEEGRNSLRLILDGRFGEMTDCYVEGWLRINYSGDQDILIEDCIFTENIPSSHFSGAIRSTEFHGGGISRINTGLPGVEFFNSSFDGPLRISPEGDIQIYNSTFYNYLNFRTSTDDYVDLKIYNSLFYTTIGGIKSWEKVDIINNTFIGSD